MSNNDSTILITGATGSFGSALCRWLLSNTTHQIRALARSESRLAQLQYELNSNRVTYILADIRDRERLDSAFAGCDYIIHAAALKVAPMGERHTSEFVKTNIAGTINVASAAIANQVPRVLFISSDKACQALNAYGRTKAVAEAVITESNMHSTHTRLASVRGGNVWGSRGSVVERWMTNAVLEVTDPDATRFHLPMAGWLQFCYEALLDFHGGEVYIPRCRSWRLGTLAEAFIQHFPDKIVIQGSTRDGDKKHEVLVSQNELPNTKDVSWAYIIEPGRSIRDVWQYEEHKGYPVEREIGSDTAAKMGVDELRTAIARGG